MPKVAIYCRLSIEDTDKAENDASASIQNQKAMLRDYCHERDWEIYDIYIDDGYSGIDRSRPEFNRMLRDCEAGHIDIVLCKDQSRFSRDTVVIEQILNDKFLEWGIRFIGVADNADTNNESYSTMRLFTSAYNEMYVKDISSKIRRTLAYKRENGQFIGSFAPYGYRIDPKDKHRLIIDETAAKVVRKIYNMYVGGAGYRSIVLKLNSDGIVSPSEYKHQEGSNYVNLNADNSNARGLWTQSTVARILQNEMYTGTLVQGKSHHISYKNKKRRKVEQADWIRIPNSHEAIIDNETWLRTQERLSSNSRVGKRSQELSPLAGKVRCACCGRPMKRHVYYNRTKTVKYYGLQCATYKTGAMNCPNKSSISGLVLEKHILGELNAIVKQFCQADDIQLTDIQAEQLKDMERRLDILDRQKKTASERLVKMYKDKLDGALSDADYALFRQDFSSEEKKIAEQIKSLSQQIADCRKRQESAESRWAMISQYTHFDKLDRSIADEFIDYIEIGETCDNGEREIHIHWKL